MQTIATAAYLKTCELCGGHGYIILPDGTQSRPLITKKEANDEVAHLLTMTLIQIDEAHHLYESIRVSSLGSESSAHFTGMHAIFIKGSSTKGLKEK